MSLTSTRGTLWHNFKMLSSRSFLYREVLKADPCSYCGGPGGTLDHIIPRAKESGPNTWENLTGACAKCNTEKGSDRLVRYLWKREDKRQRLEAFRSHQTKQHRQFHCFKLAEVARIA